MHSFHFFKSDHSAPNHRKSNLSKNSDFCTSEFNLCGQSFLKDCTPDFKGTWHNNNIKVVVDAIYYICLNEILQRPLVKIELEILALQTLIFSRRMFFKNCTALQNSLRLGTIIMWIKAAQLLRDRYIFYNLYRCDIFLTRSLSRSLDLVVFFHGSGASHKSVHLPDFG